MSQKLYLSSVLVSVFTFFSSCKKEDSGYTEHTTIPTKYWKEKIQSTEPRYNRLLAKVTLSMDYRRGGWAIEGNVGL